MGYALKAADRMESAVEAYRMALAARPDFVPVYKNLGTALKDLGRTAEGFEVLRAGAKIMFAPKTLSDDEMSFTMRTSVAKLKHDAEQIRYLVAKHRITDNFSDTAAAYDELVAAQPLACPPTASFDLPPAEQRKIDRTYNRLIYLSDGERCQDAAVNPKLDSNLIQGHYHASKPEITYFDDFLTNLFAQNNL